MKIGILGGGQLARMMALSCHQLGIIPFIVSDKENSPCKGISNLLVTNFEDVEAISLFLKDCEAITYEFENIPIALVDALSLKYSVFPHGIALNTTRERVVEKSFAKKLGIAVPNFIFANSPLELLELSKDFAFPAILKTNSSGYDGKGQWSFGSYLDLKENLSQIANVPVILEEKINFQSEFSIIGVRDRKGNISYYDPCENTHSNGILVKTLVGGIGRETEAYKVGSSYVQLLLEALNYVGVLSVEFFQCDGQILFNEYAPRVHNSGHWTIEGAHCSQFENHIRAVMGMSLGSTSLVSPSLMLNLLGTRGDRDKLLAIPNLHYHWYAKADISNRRKVGHITILGANTTELLELEKSANSLF